jgi:uncharacterized membrane protein YqiK
MGAWRVNMPVENANGWLAGRELVPTLGLTSGEASMIAIGVVVVFVLFFVIFIIKQYKRCPSNRVLVIYGKVGRLKSSKCQHGGGAFIIPVIQSYSYLSLEPIVIEIPLEGALSLNNIRVNVPSTFTVGISTDPVLMNNAAERLLNMHVQNVREQAQDIILGQLRLVLATLTIEEINKDREKFMKLINENVGQEINKIGLELINVNVRDITDESGYIQAIGKRAAAEAVNRAKVEVAQQERDGQTGEALANREKEVKVAAETAAGIEGRKLAEQKQRVAVAAMEAEAIKGEAESQREREISIAQRAAETMSAKKMAEQEQRIRVAQAEAAAVRTRAVRRWRRATRSWRRSRRTRRSVRRWRWRRRRSWSCWRSGIRSWHGWLATRSRRRRLPRSGSRSRRRRRPRRRGARRRAWRTGFCRSLRRRRRAFSWCWRRRRRVIAS